MEDLVLCHTRKKSGPTVVATFDLFLPEGPDQAQGASGQCHDEGDTPFSGHMEMYYFTAEDEPVSIMQAHLDMKLVRPLFQAICHSLYVTNVATDQDRVKDSYVRGTPCRICCSNFVDPDKPSSWDLQQNSRST